MNTLHRVHDGPRSFMPSWTLFLVSFCDPSSISTSGIVISDLSCSKRYSTISILDTAVYGLLAPLHVSYLCSFFIACKSSCRLKPFSLSRTVLFGLTGYTLVQTYFVQELIAVSSYFLSCRPIWLMWRNFWFDQIIWKEINADFLVDVEYTAKQNISVTS